MEVNINNPELKETKSKTLSFVSLDELKKLREQKCSESKSKQFKLETFQRFLRRILSPDSPVRNLLVVHGTGTGKTCTAIQIAEEYIIRPEFQDKPILVLAQPPVQNNFKNQIFDITKVSVDNGIVLSQQCTGRRYLDMISRIQSEPMKWTDPQTREKIVHLSQKLILEFYEFQGYTEFSNNYDREDIGKLHLETWIHKTFDNRMIIIDEAHNLRTIEEGEKTKNSSRVLEEIIKVANNLTLILLTATPMFDDYTEILYYFNLFLWNERKQKSDLKYTTIFDSDGDFKPKMEKHFRDWCSQYISYVKGDNPLTFPFKLMPPSKFILKPSTYDVFGNPIPIKERRQYLQLVGSEVKGEQLKKLKNVDNLVFGITSQQPTLCVFPNNETFKKVFKVSNESSYNYEKNIPKFLSPSLLENYSSKFKLVTEIIKESKGIIFIYSNFVEYGAQLFAMCLEEHGYISALGTNLLGNISEEVPRGSLGKYALFTSTNTTNYEQIRLLERLRVPSNSDGSDIKIIIGSKTLSEGIDLKYIRQIHILDFSWNMSGLEQAIGRGIRTCSHSILPFEEQNCTVFLHVCKLPKSIESIDEYYYRVTVEQKGKDISKIKNIIKESAIDCELQKELNNIPEEIKEIRIEQISSYKDEKVSKKLKELISSMFEESTNICSNESSVNNEIHERPLSSYLDVKDEILDILLKLFLRKPLWDKKELLNANELENYDNDVILYILQSIIESKYEVKDLYGRIGFLESKGNLYSFTTDSQNTLQERYIKSSEPKIKLLVKREKEIKKEKNLEELKERIKILPEIKKRFSNEILEWYIFDEVMTLDEKRKYFLKQDWKDVPPFIKILKTKHLKILGSFEIYKSTNEKIVPIGDLKDEYDEWLEERKQLFLKNKDNFYVTVDKGKLKFNLNEENGKLIKVERNKTLGGKTCNFYSETILNLFSEWLYESYPSYIKNISNKCQYLSFLVREIYLNDPTKIYWITPEEWEIFSEPENRKDLLQRIKS